MPDTVDHSDMKLGKLAPQPDPRARDMAQVMAALSILGTPPYWRVNWGRRLPANLGEMANDRLGDCTCAALGHFVQLTTAWGGPGQMVTPSDAQVISAYSGACGYVPGRPATDQGGVMTEVLNWWLANPNVFNGHKIAGWATIGAGNLSDMKNAIWLFGCANVGIALPRSAQRQTVWDFVGFGGDGRAGSWGGHDVIVIGWDDHAQQFNLITWGQQKKMTYRFWQAYCDEAYAMANKDWVMASNALTPSDVTWDQLVADLRAFYAA